MGLPRLLHNFFDTPATTAKRLLTDAEAAKQLLLEYRTSTTRKFEVVTRLGQAMTFGADMKELKQLLEHETSYMQHWDVTSVCHDLEALEHDTRIKRVHRLEATLDYAETTYKYIFTLLEQLHHCLQLQHKHLDVIERGDLRAKEKLTDEVEVESVILDKMGKIEDFHEFFVRLLNGERKVEWLDAKAARVAKRIEQGLHGLFAGGTAGVTLDWAQNVFNGIEDKVHEAVENGALVHHPNVDFEFVNSDAFIELARAGFAKVRSHRAVSEPVLQALVHHFRTYYNARD